MSDVAPSLQGHAIEHSVPEEDDRFVGIVTRGISWILDAIVINLVALFTGLGVQLIVSIFPVSKDLSSVFKPIAAVVYGVWAAAYFIVFWSVAGQTPGARLMQIRLVSANQQKVKPFRAVVRWVGMNLAMLPLFAGYLPLLVRRRAFPDWLAHTLVIDTPELSAAAVRREKMRAAYERARHQSPVSLAATAPNLSVSDDGSGSPATGTIADRQI